MLSRTVYPQNMTVQVIRFPENPTIYPELDPSIGANINGPSLIRVPEWVERPLGRYYLYFAHHQGQFIRLAYADTLSGPWRVYPKGTLHLDETVCTGHIASPDAHVDEQNSEIRIYFHGPHAGKQVTFLATSQDGLRFSAGSEVLGTPYFRVFGHDDWYYAIAMNYHSGGILLRSKDGRTRFEEGPHLFPRIRHAAVRKADGVLQIFFTRVGDKPERILVAHMSLAGDWTRWQPSDPVSLLEPELGYEGVTLPLKPSQYGAVHRPVRQLRDPAIFEEEGRTYLLYSVAGERGIAIAELLDDLSSPITSLSG